MKILKSSDLYGYADSNNMAKIIPYRYDFNKKVGLKALIDSWRTQCGLPLVLKAIDRFKKKGSCYLLFEAA